MNRRLLLVIGSALALGFGFAACNKSNKPDTEAKTTEPKPADPKSSETKPSAKPALKASDPKPETKPPARRPWIDEVGRGGASCEFAAWDGKGKDRVATFKLAMPAAHKDDVTFMQTWQFYYDKAGKPLERYPHALSYDSSAPVQKLGATGDSINKATAAVECEITSLRFKDGTFWFNNNLVPLAGDRPKGGFPDDYLKAHSGEKVVVEVLDPKKRHVKLKNISDKPVKKLEISIHYFLADGTHKTAQQNVDLVLKPGETVERKDIEFVGDDVPEYKTAEGVAPRVYFSDDTEFENRNLSDIPN